VIVYLDSSVVIRRLFGQNDALDSWHEIDEPVSSELVRVECLRTIDRAAIRAAMAGADVAELRSSALDLLARIRMTPVSSEVLARAAESFPTSLGTLDALHLSTAVLMRDSIPYLQLATHDQELAVGARSMGFEVLGVQGM